jgi:protein-S-isoprenylcysteine O-methyltransferase Ste14
MQRYFAALSIVLLIGMVITRVLLLNKQGIKAMKFGRIDKKDFLMPPFALFYFYLVFANAFNWPTIHQQEIFRDASADVISWIGVILCLAGLIVLLWSLISFQKSFRVGIDVDHGDKLITTGVFAFSRNPIYVSFGLVLIGQFLVFSGWILFVYIIGGILLFHRQVLREEEFLKKHYGKEYLEYCKRVRRYL